MALRNLIAALMLSTVCFVLFGQQSGQYVEPVRSTDPATDVSLPSGSGQAVSPRCSGDSNVDYILDPTDQFEVRSPEAEEIDHKQFRVRNDGNVLLPLVGLIHVAGMSCEELQVDLVRRLSKYIRAPHVFIKMTVETRRSGSRNLAEKPPLPASNQPTTISGAMATQELLTRGVPRDSRAMDTDAKGSIRQNDIYETANIARSSPTTESTTIASAMLPISSSPSSPTITLPVEVIGQDGTVSTASFVIPPEVPLNQRLRLRMQIHGLRYETEASIKVNSSVWLPLNSSSTSLDGLASAYGGIGGGFHTLTLTINLPLSAVRSGSNTILFRFNHSDNIVSGYRVLAFNIEDSRGNGLIPASTFVDEDPRNWKAPSSLASDISAGEALWHNAPLTTPTASGTESIKARCADCHSEDGRDLKYFNYSNNSIVARSVFHGLTQEQGTQIASYIRSLNVPNPGRPWNPPYQPGPGLDSQPVANWSAGAGLSAVLGNDTAMLPYLMPGGSTAGWVASAYLNPRELPLALQLPDWNSWLPTIHPIDSFAATFTSSGCGPGYTKVRGELQPNSARGYQGALFDFDAWQLACNATFLVPIETKGTGTPALRQAVFSVALWQMVKLWEINQIFGLESMPQVPFGTKANVRGWYSGEAFGTSPLILHVSVGPGIGNGSRTTWEYTAQIWYNLQLILNDGQGKELDHTPIDYGYITGTVKDLCNNSGLAQALHQTAWLIKDLQEETLKGKGPDQGPVSGFQNPPAVILVHPGWAQEWTAVSSSQRASIAKSYLQAWFNQVSSYSVAQWDASRDGDGKPLASPTMNPATSDSLTTFAGQVWYMLPRFRTLGVDPKLVLQVSNWAATVWPAGNWALNNRATCASDLGSCSDGQ